MRVYGADLRERLERAGFSVRVVRYAEQLPPATVRHHRLTALPGP